MYRFKILISGRQFSEGGWNISSTDEGSQNVRDRVKSK